MRALAGVPVFLFLFSLLFSTGAQAMRTEVGTLVSATNICALLAVFGIGVGDV
jgi:hypothetical protein